ncbi:MAG: M48 family metalloprotease [Candidatus Eremiobacteraeota bacterium]|nr:M48 family metalloprotease [Candidatus Eremiobacteraeota bacterium]
MRLHTFHRSLAAALIVLMIALPLMPAPAAAMSTAKEVAQGADINRQIDNQSVLINDPFLTTWVNGIGAKLAALRARQDITYRFEILDSNEVNAFALPGGFLHIDMGLLNYVGSDDELAAVMGHEMGHVERRHVVTLNQKGTLLGILIGVLSILSPIAYVLGGTAGDLAFSKFSREDELQADQYGLLLMTRAGYDPLSNIDMMVGLGRLGKDGPDSAPDKAFQSHPLPKDRINHLLGYPELDNPPADQIIAQGLHDEAEGRFMYARARLTTALAKASGNSIAREHVARLNVALHESGAPGQPHERIAAASLPDAYGLSDVATRIAEARSVTDSDTKLARERSKAAAQDIESLFNALEAQSNSIPNLGSPKKKGNNLSQAVDGLNRITRAINGTLDFSSDALHQAPKLAAENQGPLKDMADTISEGPPTAKTRALLPLYPSLVTALAGSSDQLVQGVDQARAAISMGSDALQTLKDFLAALNGLDTTSGDITSKDMPKVQAAMDHAVSAWEAASTAAADAANLVYAAQTTTLSVQVTLLDLYSSRERYAAFQRALAYRFPGVQTPDYAAVLRSGVAPGELSCNAWLSYETKTPVSQWLQTERRSGLPCTQQALDRHLLGESMEIAEGLIYQNYIQEPAKV